MIRVVLGNWRCSNRPRTRRLPAPSSIRHGTRHNLTIPRCCNSQGRSIRTWSSFERPAMTHRSPRHRICTSSGRKRSVSALQNTWCSWSWTHSCRSLLSKLRKKWRATHGSCRNRPGTLNTNPLGQWARSAPKGTLRNSIY